MRVSTVDQNPENQRLQLENYVKSRGFDVKWYEEKESTRKTRPVKEEILRGLRNREFEGVIFWRLFRWARSTTELILEFNELCPKGIKYISVADLGEIDYNNPFGKYQVTIYTAFGELERDLIRERTNEGLARAKAKGKKLGRPKGSKDKKVRRKSGYHQRWAKGD